MLKYLNSNLSELQKGYKTGYSENGKLQNKVKDKEKKVIYEMEQKPDSLYKLVNLKN